MKSPFGASHELCTQLLSVPHTVRRWVRAGQRLPCPSSDMCTIVETGILIRYVVGPSRHRFVAEVHARDSIVRLPAQLFGRDADLACDIIAPLQATVLQLPIAIMRESVRRSPVFAEAAIDAFRAQHAVLTSRMAILTHRAPVQRVAAALLYLAERFAKGGAIACDELLPLTQDLIAATADISRQTVNRALGELRDRGTIVARRAQVAVCDPVALAELAHHDGLSSPPFHLAAV